VAGPVIINKIDNKPGGGYLSIECTREEELHLLEKKHRRD
jgi:hypothetical protein